MKVEVDVPGLPVPNNPYGLCGRKATLNSNCTVSEVRSCVKSGGGRPGLPVPNNPYGLCGRKATLNSNCSISELRSCVKL